MSQFELQTSWLWLQLHLKLKTYDTLIITCVEDAFPVTQDPFLVHSHVTQRKKTVSERGEKFILILSREDVVEVCHMASFTCKVNFLSSVKWMCPCVWMCSHCGSCKCTLNWIWIIKRQNKLQPLWAFLCVFVWTNVSLGLS